MCDDVTHGGDICLARTVAPRPALSADHGEGHRARPWRRPPQPTRSRGRRPPAARARTCRQAHGFEVTPAPAEPSREDTARHQHLRRRPAEDPAEPCPALPDGTRCVGGCRPRWWGQPRVSKKEVFLGSDDSSRERDIPEQEPRLVSGGTMTRQHSL